MITYFEPFSAAACCLCGSDADPTGEHKIKASSLREQFGQQKMVVVREADPPRVAQGPKSMHFHFDAPTCKPCNSRRTQAEDTEWDRFRRDAHERMAAGETPDMAFETARYAPIGPTTCSPAYLNVLRYLAKLMANHLADDGAPRSKRLTEFALGLSDDCPIFVGILHDPTYAAHARIHGDHPYAAHGGLVLLSDRATGTLTGFHTTITVGGLQCTIAYRPNPDELHALLESYPEFITRHRNTARGAADNPVPNDLLVKLGLAGWDQTDRSLER